MMQNSGRSSPVFVIDLICCLNFELQSVSSANVFAFHGFFCTDAFDVHETADFQNAEQFLLLHTAKSILYYTIAFISGEKRSFMK